MTNLPVVDDKNDDEVNKRLKKAVVVLSVFLVFMLTIVEPEVRNRILSQMWEGLQAALLAMVFIMPITIGILWFGSKQEAKNSNQEKNHHPE